MPARLRRSSRRLPVLFAVAVFAVALLVLALRADDSGSPDRLSGPVALKSALADPEVGRYLHEYRYTRTKTIPLDGENMRASFFDGSRIVLDAAVAPDGSVPHTIEYEPGYVRAGNRAIQTPLALVILSLVFVLAVTAVPLRHVRNLDVLALLSFGVSIVLLNERLFELSVWAGYPPLAYLCARCLRFALSGKGASAPNARPLYDVVTAAWSSARRRRLLLIAAVASAVALVIASVPGGTVGDVGFASMAGATQLLDGRLPYGHLPSEIVHGDTYPLLAYALYIPVALFMPVHDAFDNLDGVLIVAAAATLLAAGGVYLASTRTGASGDRDEGLRHGIALLVFPPVIITASSGSNDMVAAALVAGALAVLLRATRSSALLAVAGWVKLIPFFLLPFLAARFRSRALVRVAAAVAVTTLAVVGWILLLGGIDGLERMIDGVSFQAERGSPLSLWTLLGIKPAQIALQAAVLSLVAVSPFLVTRNPALARDPRRLAALAAAILIGFQLAANYWSYAYLPWVLPCVMIALLAGSARPTSGRLQE